MNNTQRQAVYLRDRSTLSPAQQRRVTKHAHMEVAQFSRATRRSAKRQVLAAARRQRLSIRALFARRAA